MANAIKLAGLSFVHRKESRGIRYIIRTRRIDAIANGLPSHTPLIAELSFLLQHPQVFLRFLVALLS